MAVLAGCLAASGACDRDAGQAGPAAAATADTPQHNAVPTTTQTAGVTRIVFLGDSLTAGLGVDADEAFPSVVERALEREGLRVRVVNGGVSGDTTAGGLRRLDWLLRQKPDVVVVGLGGNDGLRGLDLAASEQNLRAIVQKSRDAGADVLLLGMLIPPNYGPDYAGNFREIYPRIAREMDVPLVPFVLQGVGGEPKLNQPDGIHPTSEGHRLIAENVLAHLRSLARQRASR